MRWIAAAASAIGARHDAASATGTPSRAIRRNWGKVNGDPPISTTMGNGRHARMTFPSAITRDAPPIGHQDTKAPRRFAVGQDAAPRRALLVSLCLGGFLWPVSRLKMTS